MRIPFQGYAGDCTVSGEMDLDGSRLSDALDRLDELVVHSARLHSLADGREVDAGEIVLQRDDLFAIEGGGAAGEDQRRVRMVRHMLCLRMGPYTCFGELHTLPGAAPLRTLLVRRTMVPLTGCLLVFRRNGRDEARRLPMLIVNARRIDHVDEATSEQLAEHAALVAKGAAEQPAAERPAPVT